MILGRNVRRERGQLQNVTYVPQKRRPTGEFSFANGLRYANFMREDETVFSLEVSERKAAMIPRGRFITVRSKNGKYLGFSA